MAVVHILNLVIVGRKWVNMEPYIADLINNPKVPKIIRYLIVVIVCAFIIYLGITTFIDSPFIWGKILGIILAIVFLIVGIYLCLKISRSKERI